MCGLPGSGKTTTAHRIRQALDDAFVFSRDHIRNWYRKNDSFDEHSEREAMVADNQFFRYIEELLPFYNTVILDATFKQYEKREAAFDFAKQRKCQLILIECICSDPVLLERLTRQFLSGEKVFFKPPKELLDYYMRKMQEPQDDLDGISLIKLDTEKNKILLTSRHGHICQFTQQLIEILKQPFEASLSNSFGQLPLTTELR